jgi:hypothetical protein
VTILNTRKLSQISNISLLQSSVRKINENSRRNWEVGFRGINAI